ncbi:hypothetical protein ACFRAR_11445 [Kitasatospora sp. NPDC056651]|uniref:hypothetical protein n=1 Tax=Kitasatospora sp. NPDC056651 TaxID=3345892 RepID=UPI00367BF8C0
MVTEFTDAVWPPGAAVASGFPALEVTAQEPAEDGFIAGTGLTLDPQHHPDKPKSVGTYESGFPDEYAFQDWLYRLECLTEDESSLTAGEHVSGPAADAYRARSPRQTASSPAAYSRTSTKPWT